MSVLFSKNKRNGFTLVELLVALAITGMVLAAVSNLFISSNKLYTVQSKVSNVQQDIRAAMSIMARDIRMAGYDNPEFEDDNSGITNADSTRFVFTYDNSTGGSETYGYRYDSSSRSLDYNFPNTGGDFQGLTEEDTISDVQFVYNLEDGGWTNSPADPSNVRQVRVRLCGQISGPYSDAHDSAYCFNNTITCRNMLLKE